jgi:thymidylate kinase
VDFHASKPPPERVAGILDRCKKQRRVRLREVLELRALVREGHAPPPHDPVAAVAARIESGLGGALLSGWLNGRSLEAPADLRAARLRSVGLKIKRLFRRKVVIAISGVDGSGKSLLCDSLARSLANAAIPVATVWTRPGMRLGVLDRVAGVGKRVLRQDPAPGVRSVAGGAEAGTLASRRGVVGWVWALLVTLAFLIDVRKRHFRTSGVVIYDRHLLDAVVTLHFAYAGINLRLQDALIKMFLPQAALTLYLKASANVAVSRKPGDVIGEHAITRQLELYERFASEAVNLHELDAEAAPTELTMTALRALAIR